MQTTGILWRDTARPVRFGLLDARVVTGFLAWMMYMSWPTFWLSVGLALLFIVLERYGITPPAAWRYFRQGFFSPVRRTASLYPTRRMTR